MDGITYPFPNSRTVKVWEWILVISHTLYRACDYLSLLGLKLVHIIKRVHVVSVIAMRTTREYDSKSCNNQFCQEMIIWQILWSRTLYSLLLFMAHPLAHTYLTSHASSTATIMWRISPSHKRNCKFVLSVPDITYYRLALGPRLVYSRHICIYQNSRRPAHYIFKSL